MSKDKKECIVCGPLRLDQPHVDSGCVYALEEKVAELEKTIKRLNRRTVGLIRY